MTSDLTQNWDEKKYGPRFSGEDEAMFERPSEFRREAVLEVWEKAERVRGKPDHRKDYRTKEAVGPWKAPDEPGEDLPSRRGVWDMGHKKAWYKVEKKLRKRHAKHGDVTRDEVLDAFNNVKNLGVEDPVTNQERGSNSEVTATWRDRSSIATAAAGLLSGGALSNIRQRFNAAKAGSAITETTTGQAMSKDDDDLEELQELDIEAPEITVVWDVETTGLSHKKGEGIVEIAGIKLRDGKTRSGPNGEAIHPDDIMHYYVKPIDPETGEQRPVSSSALGVHGLTDEFLAEQETFEQLEKRITRFMGKEPKLAAHNAHFDMGFINAERERIGEEPYPKSRKIDTLHLAKKLIPEDEIDDYDLDSLADHLGVDRSAREEYHGALVDTVILAKVTEKLFDLADELEVPITAEQKEEAEELAKASRGIDAVLDEQMSLEAAMDEGAALLQERLNAKKVAEHGPATPKVPGGGFAERHRANQAAPQQEGGLGAS